MEISWELIGMLSIAVLVWTIGAFIFNWAGDKIMNNTITGAILFLWMSAVSSATTFFIMTGPLRYVVAP